MNPLAFLALIGALLAPPAYFVAQPYLAAVPVKLYHVQLTRIAGGLGGDVEIIPNITGLGTGTIPTYQKSGLESIPPVHSYLIVKAGSKTTYAVVFWTNTADGKQIASIDRLNVLISSAEDLASFTYSSEASLDVSLGTY